MAHHISCYLSQCLVNAIFVYEMNQLYSSYPFCFYIFMTKFSVCFGASGCLFDKGCGESIKAMNINLKLPSDLSFTAFRTAHKQHSRM